LAIGGAGGELHLEGRPSEDGLRSGKQAARIEAVEIVATKE